MPSTLPYITLWIIFAFFCGSLPFSVWISHLFGKDVRSVGDGNPGAINALKAGGWYVGLISFLLDVSKAAAPVGLAYQIWEWRSWEIVPVALAPLLGSIFSPFLKFKGGKSLSVSLGIWIGLTLWKAPLFILTSLTVVFLIQNNPAWAVIASILSIALFLIFCNPNPIFGMILGIQAILLLWTHRKDFGRRPELRKWIRRI